MKINWPGGTCAAPPCPVCDQPGPFDVVLRTTKPDATLVRCGRCTARFFPGQAPPDYAADKPASLFVQFYAEQNAGLHQMIRPLWQIDAAAHGIDSLLDVGCGFGFPVDTAARVLGWRAVGVDPSFFADAGREMLGADIRRCYLTEQTDVGPPFGMVLAMEVIEHIPDLYPFMALMRRHIAPGGVLVMGTPHAGGILPETNPGTLAPMLTVGAHLVLFTAPAMEFYLRRAGFQHVVCRVEEQTLFVFASDRPLVFLPGEAAAHAGYVTYLQCLIDGAAPGSTLWNGAAGRLLGAMVDSGPLDAVLALYARIASAWRERFGIDLVRQRLPPVRAERDFGITGPDLVESLRAEAPINLPAVLYHRTVLERRMPVATPESIVAHARLAMVYAGQTYRALRDYGLVDHHLRDCAWQARVTILDQFTILAPELEPSLLSALVHPAPEGRADTLDPPRPVVVIRLAGVFNRLVHDGRYDEAMTLYPAMDNLDAVTTALAHDPMVLFHALFCVGVLRLNHLGAPGAARDAFTRMRDEAVARLDSPRPDIARYFQGVAEEHMRLVPDPLPAPVPAAPPQAAAPRRARRA